ncbi:oligosaccharide flippase family protein [Pseudodesulfovibrio cashew]|uniref:Oligosaccharide flippase family protein n=1 Tax=Pseudodesulfovibrio cashew TaxID=2678688 RepID=A0A6I6JCZ6_9BACT|nr:oligosaccharide flippase family protein [Pseudodesulfovibrio cashew]QGY39019.1 oligosaccharide flippase family protein [Pseudodesulfovibrio cashew]
MKTLKRLYGFFNSSHGSLSDKVLRSAAWLGIGSVVVNTLVLVRSIILARLLLPEVFGLMTTAFMIMRLANVFTQTGLNTALIQRKESIEDAKSTAFILTLLRGMLLYGVFYLFSPFISKFYGDPILETMLKVLAITFIFSSALNINIITSKREVDFKTVSIYTQFSSIISFIVTITMVYIKPDLWSLVIAQVICSFINMLLSYYFFPIEKKFDFNFNIAKELIQFGKYMTGISIATFLTTEIDNFTVGKVIGMEPLGYYIQAYTLANLPSTHITSILGNIITPAYSKLQGSLDLLVVAYLKVLRVISSIVIPAAFGLFFLASDIILILYGERWAPAILPLKVLCVFGLIRSVASTTGPLFIAIGKPNLVYRIQTYKLIFICLLIYPLTRLYGIVGTSYAVMIPMVCEQFLLWSMIVKEFPLQLNSLFSAFRGPVCSSLIMLLYLHYVDPGDLSPMNLAFKVLSGAAVYGIAFLTLFYKDTKTIYRSFIKKRQL